MLNLMCLLPVYRHTEECNDVGGRPPIDADMQLAGVREELGLNALTAVLDDLPDVPRHGLAGRDLDFRVEHTEELAELRILHDRERAMAAGTPEREKITHTRGGVLDAVRVVVDSLAFGRFLALA